MTHNSAEYAGGFQISAPFELDASSITNNNGGGLSCSGGYGALSLIHHNKIRESEK